MTAMPPSSTAAKTTPQLRDRVWTLLVSAALLTLLALYSICFVVQAGTVAVLKTFGAITAVIDKPGLYWKWIYPIQTVVIIDKRTRVHDQPGAEVQTQDKFNILVNLAVGWHISDERTFVSRFASEEEAVRALRPRIDDARMQAINSIRLSDIVSADAEQAMRFAAFEHRIAEALQLSLADPKAGFGVTVDFVKVRSIAFPDSVSQKVFERMSKERQILSLIHI